MSCSFPYRPSTACILPLSHSPLDNTILSSYHDLRIAEIILAVFTCVGVVSIFGRIAYERTRTHSQQKMDTRITCYLLLAFTSFLSIFLLIRSSDPNGWDAKIPIALDRILMYVGDSIMYCILIYLSNRLWLTPEETSATTEQDATLSTHPITKAESMIFPFLLCSHLLLGTLSGSVIQGYIPSIFIVCIDMILIIYIMIEITRRVMIRYSKLKYQAPVSQTDRFAKLSMSSLPSSVSIASPAAAAQQRLLLISYSIITAIAITCFAFMIYLIVDAAQQQYDVIHSNYETDGSKGKIFMEQGTLYWLSQFLCIILSTIICHLSISTSNIKATLSPLTSIVTNDTKQPVHVQQDEESVVHVHFRYQDIVRLHAQGNAIGHHHQESMIGGLQQPVQDVTVTITPAGLTSPTSTINRSRSNTPIPPLPPSTSLIPITRPYSSSISTNIPLPPPSPVQPLHQLETIDGEDTAYDPYTHRSDHGRLQATRWYAPGASKSTPLKSTSTSNTNVPPYTLDGSRRASITSCSVLNIAESVASLQAVAQINANQTSNGEQQQQQQPQQQQQQQQQE